MADHFISVNADKFLFAEDIVAFVFRHDCEVQLPPIVRHYRELIYNGFNDTLKTAVEFIESVVEQEVYKDYNLLKEEDCATREGYVEYASNLRQICFHEGLDLEQFLYYCVHMGILASRFLDEGEPEAPLLAVLAIVDALREYDMLQGGWSILNRVAQKFASVAADVEDLDTPPSSPSELSDDENVIPSLGCHSENYKCGSD